MKLNRALLTSFALFACISAIGAAPSVAIGTAPTTQIRDDDEETSPFLHLVDDDEETSPFLTLTDDDEETSPF